MSDWWPEEPDHRPRTEPTWADVFTTRHGWAGLVIHVGSAVIMIAVVVWLLSLVL